MLSLNYYLRHHHDCHVTKWLSSCPVPFIFVSSSTCNASAPPPPLPLPNEEEMKLKVCVTRRKLDNLWFVTWYRLCVPWCCRNFQRHCMDAIAKTRNTKHHFLLFFFCFFGLFCFCKTTKLYLIPVFIALKIRAKNPWKVWTIIGSLVVCPLPRCFYSSMRTTTMFLTS